MLGTGDFVIRELLDHGVITEADVARAGEHAAASPVDIVDALLELDIVNKRQIAVARASISECPYVALDHYEIELKNAELLPRSVAEKLGAYPLFDVEDVATVGMIDPLDLRAVDQVRQLLKKEVDPVLCEEDALRSVISRGYSLTPLRSAAEAEEEYDADLTTGEEPIVAAVNHIIARAIDEGASDIHINPDEQTLHLRYRIDGLLQSRQGPPVSAHAALVQRLKVMAHMDLTQTRRPQDGKFRYQHHGEAYDLRMSTLPTVNGENVVLRILARGGSILGFEELGMSPDMVEAMKRMLAAPHGIILVTGPTGSGKTTTLYTAISKLNTPDRNVMTIEDPVEIRLPMVRQTQVNAEIGMTFAGTLRSILRQDPDVVLVGEIRDEETAQIAVQASLTGHLVLSTLHTNDAVGAVPRLMDLGVPAFAINSALLGVLAQRLVRRVCDHCKETAPADDITLRSFGLDPEERGAFVRGAGCGKCMDTGYRGRVGVYEGLTMTPGVQEAIEAGGSPQTILRAAKADGMRLMWEDGLRKARIGLTTLDELSRVRASCEDYVHETPDDARMCA